MKYKRRDFIKKSTILSAAGVTIPHVSFASKPNRTLFEERPKVLFFDVNETLLDLTAMKCSVATALNGRNDLLPLWFTTMLQYSLVSTVANQYNDFAVIVAAFSPIVSAFYNIKLSDEEAKKSIVEPIRSLPAHPEVASALEQLKNAGYELVSFTNSSNIGVATQFENAGLTQYFDQRLSVEDIGKFKPHVDAYNWAARKMNIQPSECLLVAAHGWDIAGALWANWRGAFISRPGAQLYPLSPSPEINETNLKLVAEKLISL